MKTDIETIERELDRLLNRIQKSQELRALSRAANPSQALGDTVVMLKMCNHLIDCAWEIKKAKYKLNHQ